MKKEVNNLIVAAPRFERDALASAELLSGDPVLARGTAVLAAVDPLGLAQPRGGVRATLSLAATRSDHTSPERRIFRLPVIESEDASAAEDDLVKR